MAKKETKILKERLRDIDKKYDKIRSDRENAYQERILKRTIVSNAQRRSRGNAPRIGGLRGLKGLF